MGLCGHLKRHHVLRETLSGDLAIALFDLNTDRPSPDALRRQ
jgi:hypothetical protein